MRLINRFVAGSLCVGLCLVLASPGFAKPAKAKGARVLYGKAAPFAAEELPEGKLKAKLKTLDPEAKEKAMKWLHRFSFPATDAAVFLRVDNEGGIYHVDADDKGNFGDSKMPIPEHFESTPPLRRNLEEKAPYPLQRDPQTQRNSIRPPYPEYQGQSQTLQPTTPSQEPLT